jgi:hypothetical protein
MLYKYIIIVALMIIQAGCTIGSNGISGPGFNLYIAPKGQDGYQEHHTGQPNGTLACEITYPPDYTSIPYGSFAMIYGVIFREGTDLDYYPWEGPEWAVDNGLIPLSCYEYDLSAPEMWVRFPLDTCAIGYGTHDITFRVYDETQTIPYAVTDHLIVKVE